MTSKEKSIEVVKKYVHLFSCPLCKSTMKVVEKSLICIKNHTFDFAKQGYLNMLIRSANSQYDKELFKARKEIIMESDLFALLHQKISEVIIENMDAFEGDMIIFDAGCGEGSHLQMILDKSDHVRIKGIGLDISKEGIRMAASNYKEFIWLVGDLANIPLVDQSCQIILNILSPANYKEFKRILIPDGLVIKIVPRINYLKELRDRLFENKNKKTNKHDDIVSLFKQHFHLVNEFKLSYSMELTQKELINLVQMTPLTWNKSQKDIEQMIAQGISQITVDLAVLVGKNQLCYNDQ